MLTDIQQKHNKLHGLFNANSNHEQIDENSYDSDKDPEYIQPSILKNLNKNALSTCISTKTKCNSSAKNSPTERVIADRNQDFLQPFVISQSKDKNKTPKCSSVKRALFETHETFNHVSDDSSNKGHYCIGNLPIGKIGAKDIDQDIGQPLSQSYYNKNNYSKFSLEKASFETNEFNQENAEFSNSRHSILNSPIGKIVVEDNDQNFSSSHSKSLSNNNNNSNTPMFSSAKTINTADKLMPNCDFPTFVLNALTKMKYDISGINSKTNATHILLNSFVTHFGNSSIQEQLNNNQIGQTSDYCNLFPIQTEEDLQAAESRILDKNVRFNLVLQLSLLVGIKGVG
ncbi:probable serine/threonine-protein kinase DDB_G0278509 isoform X3 [Acyrthosiphon pisum]|uniref:Uncharacterized protein n=1 Tax=Acyrthosiphon pisum TaxID=7029 RepID=A0A8R2JW29_ACYPI|nr:probable serine/threonine-protein kinase DDB_G0278509 isoform X3 [Acyrthosiphon pisum]